MSYATIEARAIPVLKTLANAAKKESKLLLAEGKKIEQQQIKAVLTKRFSAVLNPTWVKKTKFTYGWNKVEGGGVAFHIKSEQIVPYDVKPRALCKKANAAYKMCVVTPSLRRLAVYLRANTGSTKAALALPNNKFMALVNRYLEDLTAELSCSI